MSEKHLEVKNIRNAAYCRKYYVEHAEQEKLRAKRYKELNPEKVKAYQDQYRAKNREWFAQYAKTWRKNNPEYYLERDQERSRRLHKAKRDRLFSILGRRCIQCGFSDERALQFDHIKGDGYLDRGRFKNKFEWFNWISEQSPEVIRKSLQTLCANCNSIKRYENKEMRKGKKRKMMLKSPMLA